MFVKISETYDMSTQTNKMGLVGIHTPNGGAVHSMWPGFFQNYRKYKFVSCDVNMACASMLPADPLQIGVDAGDIAPQDMFNPILYKAVSNDSMSNLLNRLYAGQFGASGAGGPSVTSENDLEFGYDDSNDVDQFAMYYGLLADNDGWKKAMPQSGLSMRGLKPLTFSLVATQGQPAVIGSFTNIREPFNNDPATGANAGPLASAYGRFMRGPTMRMPAMPTYVKDGTAMDLDAVDSVTSADTSGAYVKAGDAWSVPAKSAVAPNLDAPQCFVAAIVLPPAKLNQLYYRMKVTWTVEFMEPRAITELSNWYGLALAGVQTYGSDYVNQSALIAKASTASVNSMVDTSEVSATKIMDSVN